MEGVKCEPMNTCTMIIIIIKCSILHGVNIMTCKLCTVTVYCHACAGHKPNHTTCACDTCHACSDLVTVKMKALKCKRLGTDDHLLNCIMYPAFTLTTFYLILMLVGNGCQLTLLRGNFNDWKWLPWPCESEKEAITRERRLFSEICIS